MVQARAACFLCERTLGIVPGDLQYVQLFRNFAVAQTAIFSVREQRRSMHYSNASTSAENIR